MKLPQLAVSRPITTIMLFLGLFILGLVAFFKLSLDFLPKVEAPVISIITFWSGNSAEDVETKVTKIIEKNLSIINNLDTIRSTTKEGLSLIHCIFEQNTNLSEASNDIRDRLEFAKGYMPLDIADPLLIKFNTGAMPIMFYGITAKESWANLPEIIEDHIEAPLKRVPGVGAVQNLGGAKKQVNVFLDRYKLSLYGISLSEIEQAISQHNLSFSAGTIEEKKREHMIRIPIEYQSLEDIGNTILKRPQGKNIRLKDISSIELGCKEEKRIVQLNNEPSMIVMIQKRSDANTVKVAQLVQEKIKQIKSSLPLDVKPILIMDSSEFITRAIHNLMKTGLWGIFFVALITFLFFQNKKASSIIILSIPLSIMIAFSFIYFTGWSLNVISLAGLAIAIGMVVDNAIVVTDSIMHHIEMGTESRKAISLGASEVTTAMIASTLTTIVVFLPLIFSSGIVGILFKQLGGVVTVALLASLLSALLLVPALASKCRLQCIEKEHKIFAQVEKLYQGLLAWTLSHRKKFTFSALTLLILSFGLLFVTGSEFFPSEDSGDLSISLNFAPGTPLEETSLQCQKVENLGKKIIGEKYLLHSFFHCGAQDSGVGVAFSNKEDNHIGYIGFKLVKQKQRPFSSQEIAQKMTSHLLTWEKIEKFDIDAGNPIAKHMFGGNAALTLEILGHDLKKTEEIARKIKEIALTIRGVKEITTNREMAKPELHVHIDKEKTASLGFEPSLIASTLRSLYLGQKAAALHQGEHQYDIFLRLNSAQRTEAKELLDTEISSPKGDRLTLANVAHLEENVGPVDIERKNQERVLTINLSFFKRSPGEILNELQKKIKSTIIFPPDISLSFGQEIKEQKKAFAQFVFMAFLGLLFVYMVMASQFESLKDPFIVMFSVPFALCGVFLSLFLTRTTLNAMSFLGMIMLIGIVVNNAIILVDYIKNIRKTGINLKEAIYKGASQRLRPILLTTFTTSLGLAPLIFSKGEGAEMWRPLGISVVGGLLCSTLVTLLFIPLLYMSFHKKEKH